MSNSCFVIGSGIVALKCLQILIQSQFNILGVYSSDRSLQSWADDHAVVHAPTRSDFYNLLLSAQYDYLFSVDNDWILPPEIITQAHISTISYHNSSLPKYAGLYATSWALIHNETQHAIGWHEVVPAIDAGRVLKQVTIPIAEDDTALSLNIRCFEVAVTIFEELVKELLENQVVYREQDLSQRSYFGQSDRPAAACLLAFDQSAKTLSNLVRALDFGPTHNPLGLPKIWLSKGVLAVGAACPIASSQGANSGQVLALNKAGLEVATADGAILLSRITTQAGIPIEPDELSAHYGIQMNAVLPAISSQMRDAISQHNATICRHESEWVRHLADLQPLMHPNFQPNFQAGAIAPPTALYRHPIALSHPIEGRSLLSLFAAYCARLASEPFDLALQTEVQRSFAPEIFAQWVPIRIQADNSESFSQFQEQFAVALAQTCRLGSYTLDVVARYPELRHSERSPGLFIGIVHALNPSCLEIDSFAPPVIFAAYEDGSPPELLHNGALSSVQSQAIAQQMQIFMTACVHNPQQSLCSLPLMSAEERQQILVKWNQTAAPYPRDRCIHELISAQAEQTPNSVAVRFNHLQLSYQELEQRSHQLAHWLRLHGVEPDRLVALCVPRSLELIIGLLGILKSGGAYVPIDPTYPADRIAYLLENSCCQAVVTIATLQDTLFPQAANVICLDRQAPLLALDTVPIESGVTPEHLAYVIYTSGSTGMPKGVEICHRALVNHSWAIANIYNLTPSDRLLQSASISFDIAGEQIYPALFRGAEIIVRPDDLMESFDRFSKFVESQAITVLTLPTAFWHEWVGDLMESGQKFPSSVRVLGVGTEKVLSDRLEQWCALAKGEVEFFQGYGPTEATITCTMYQHHGRNQDVIPIGYPLPNVELYILDPYLQPVPIGMIGELYIGGDGLARGYHQRPDLTAKSFINHPFRKSGEARLYKTGDLARFEPDGQLIYCGRTDYQIKLHGYRIEPGEIETVLNQHPEVKQAVVQTYEVKSGDRALVAYVVPKTQLALTTDQLQQFLGQRLPSYMQPNAIVFINALPITATGKVNRRALPKPQQNQCVLATPYSAPRDALERQLVEIWETVLEIRPISIQDNFFALGGNSLSAVRLADKIQAVFKSNLPLAVIFQAPILAQLYDVLRHQKKRSISTLVPIQPNGNKPPLFLFQGIGIYYPLSSCLEPDQPVYGLSFEMIEERDISKLSIAELVDRYLQDLQAVYPQGPYLLGGVSFGGLVAFEVAQKLRASGYEVALLALFDTPAPGAYTFKPILKRFQGHLRNLFELGPAYLQHKVLNKLLLFNDLLFHFTRRKSHTHNYKFVQQTYQQIAKTHSPQPYPGRISLFLATNRSVASNSVFDPRLVDIDPQFGWGSLAEGGLDIYKIPGDHLSILKKPQVQTLAKNLKLCLEKVI